MGYINWKQASVGVWIIVATYIPALTMPRCYWSGHACDLYDELSVQSLKKPRSSNFVKNAPVKSMMFSEFWSKVGKHKCGNRSSFSSHLFDLEYLLVYERGYHTTHRSNFVASAKVPRCGCVKNPGRFLSFAVWKGLIARHNVELTESEPPCMSDRCNRQCNDKSIRLYK